MEKRSERDRKGQLRSRSGESTGVVVVIVEGLRAPTKVTRTITAKAMAVVGIGNTQ